MSGKIWPLRTRVPEPLVRGFREHAGADASHLKPVLTAAYLERVKEVPSIEAKKKKSEPDSMRYREGVELVGLNWYLPEDIALDLFRYSDETGVSREAMLTLALDQFLRAHGASRTPVLETATE